MVDIGTASRMLRVHLFLNLSCRQDSEQLESVALTMLHVFGGRRKIKRVCGRQRGKSGQDESRKRRQDNIHDTKIHGEAGQGTTAWSRNTAAGTEVPGFKSCLSHLQAL